MERGTLFNLRNLINRRNVSKKCKENVNAQEEFFVLVVVGHVVAAVLHYLKMSSITDRPSHALIPDDVWMEDDSIHSSLLMNIASHIVKQHVDMSIQPSQQDKTPDKVNAYAREILSLGLLHAEFKDGIKEGDGDRVLRVWKYMLLLFKASKRTNYGMEAFNMLTQYHLVLPPRLAQQLKWLRFINTHGFPGHNISCDLHMEHINRLVKTAIEGLGANKAEKSIIRCGKMIGTLEATLNKFDEENKVPSTSGTHTKKSTEKDFSKILKQLWEINVFQTIPNRKHWSFRNLEDGLLKSVDSDKLKDWIRSSYADRYY